MVLFVVLLERLCGAPGWRWVKKLFLGVFYGSKKI